MKWITMMIAALAALTMFGVAYAVDPTPTATPAPKLSFGKTGTADTDIGGIVGFTISVTNSGNADSESQTMQDTLPGGVDWWIAADSWGCTLAPSVTAGRTVLRCGPAVAVKRHLNATADDFVNGSLSVTVFGQAFQCGAYFNVAVFNGQIPSNPAIVNVRCPVTPTPAATSTPIPTQTAQPTQVPPEPTKVPQKPEPSRPAPKPPTTGNSRSGVPDSGNGWPWGIIVIAVLVGTGTTLALWGRNRP